MLVNMCEIESSVDKRRGAALDNHQRVIHDENKEIRKMIMIILMVLMITLIVIMVISIIITIVTNIDKI